MIQLLIYSLNIFILRVPFLSPHTRTKIDDPKTKSVVFIFCYIDRDIGGAAPSVCNSAAYGGRVDRNGV